ncbi:ABC transporter substrate-binding protein [Nakamurella sp. YIM 132087]|uniref:ABC transporter substrate-binding protein n=1 Tax=Nakamurella alba TaxID=2665158 RepID=A0A7K1FT10_9ACTN|nr:ABC transporter substrate-binding protein [Nakamurella alba]MTD15954.1 ABC transporter substrate-binding protein [Nakamurella alba]
MRTSRRFRSGTAGLAAAALLLAACGSDPAPGAGTSSTAAASPAATSTAAPASSGGTSTSAATGGGSATGSAPESVVPSVASGDPIKIGAMAPMNGAAAYPQSGFGIDAGVWYVNNVLGGVQGRPLEVDLCAGDGTPETAVNCANGFVTNNYPVVVDAYDLSMGGAQPILVGAEIPVVGMLSGANIMDETPYPLGFYFSGPGAVSAVGSMTILQKLGKKNASLALTDAPATHTYVDTLITPISQKLGLNVGVQYIDTKNVNYTVAAASQLQSNPDVTGIIALPEDGCTQLFQAERDAGYTGTIFAGSCSQFIAKMGADAAGAISQPRLWLPGSRDHAPADVQADLDAFANAMTQTNHAEEQSARSLYSFSAVVALAQTLGTIDGEITNTAASKALSEIKDLRIMAGPTVTCDGKQWPGKPTACTKQAIYFEVQADGSLKVGGDGYFDLDPSLAG